MCNKKAVTSQLLPSYFKTGYPSRYITKKKSINTIQQLSSMKSV